MIRRPLALALSLAVSIACGGKKAPPEAAAISPSAAPILPAPEATVYATGQSDAPDPLVRQVVTRGLLPWQESLAGGATTLILDVKGPLDLQQAEHAARRAGYPYPVVRIITGEEPPAAYPDGLVQAVQRSLRLGDHVGVVRARVGQADRWIALIGRPAGLALPFDRQSRVGAELVLDLDRPSTWMLVSPSGALSTGRTPGAIKLDRAGEWWLEVEDENGARILSAPIFVGMAPPPAPLIELPGEPATGPDDAEVAALDLLAEVRDAFALPGLEEDGTLSTLAGHPLEQAIDRTWTRPDGEARLRGAGFVGGAVAQVWCQGETVAKCMDQLLTDAQGRAALMHPQVRLVGVRAQASTSGVVLLFNLASE
jgi:hypothetical protein